MTRIAGFAAALLLLSAIVAGGVLTTRLQAAATIRGGINMTPSERPTRYVGGNPDGWFCVDPNCAKPQPAQMTAEMTAAKVLHASDVRVQFPWNLIETSRNGYDWSKTDQIMAIAAQVGVTIEPNIVYTPAWSAPAYNQPPAPADMQAFATALVQRYPGRFPVIEVWNEEDSGAFLFNGSAATYVTTMLNPAYAGIKAADPSVQVSMGGTINDSGSCCPFLSAVVANGGKFDIANFHTYSGNVQGIAAQYAAISGKPVWVSEWSVGSVGCAGDCQSPLITSVFTNPGSVAFAQWYALRDDRGWNCCPPAAGSSAKGWGLMDESMNPKPSYATMQNLLGGAPPSPSPVASPSPSPSALPSPTPPPSPSPVPTPSTAPSPSPGPSPTPVPGGMPSALHVQGNLLVNAAGKTVTLRGANMAGTEFVCAQGWSPADPFGGQPEDNPATFAAMKSWGINAVRIPLNEDCWLGINGAVGGAAYQVPVLKLVRDLEAAGLYVIVDLHWSAPGTQLALSQNPAPDEDHSPAFWTDVATQLKGDSGVLFDLFNEPFYYWIAPGGPSAQGCLWNGCTLTQYETGGQPFTITANWQSAGLTELTLDVRGTGATNVIVVPGVNWARDPSGYLANLPPDPNTALAYHSYPSGNPALQSECAAQACWDSVIAPLAAVRPMIVGETGDSTLGPQTYLPSFLPFASSHGLSVLAWTWNAWTNPDDVLVTNMTTGAPTAGEGVTFKAWLAGAPLPSPPPSPLPSPSPIPSTSPSALPSPSPSPLPSPSPPNSFACVVLINGVMTLAVCTGTHSP